MDVEYKLQNPVKLDFNQSPPTSPSSLAALAASPRTMTRVYTSNYARLHRGLAALWSSSLPAHADVVLVCGSATLPAHRLILSIQSPVLTQLIATLSPSPTAQLQLEGEESAVRRSLAFLYTGQITL